MPPGRVLKTPACAKPYAIAIEPTAVTPHDRSEMAPTCAMFAGSMMMPEPIMLTATSTVNCIMLIFLVVVLSITSSPVSRFAGVQASVATSMFRRVSRAGNGRQERPDSTRTMTESVRQYAHQLFLLGHAKPRCQSDPRGSPR